MISKTVIKHCMVDLLHKRACESRQLEIDCVINQELFAIWMRLLEYIMALFCLTSCFNFDGCHMEAICSACILDSSINEAGQRVPLWLLAGSL